MVFTWGFNNYGQLGLQHNSTQWTPAKVDVYQYYQYAAPSVLPPI